MPIFRELCSRNRTRESGLRHESVPGVPCFLWARKEQSAFETFARRMPRDHKPNYWRIRLDFEEVATPKGTTSARTRQQRNCRFDCCASTCASTHARLSTTQVYTRVSTGRKTGKARRTPVGDGHIGNEFWLLAEHGIKAGYVRNIERDPHVTS